MYEQWSHGEWDAWPNHRILNQTLLLFLYSDHQQLAKLIQESPTIELKENLECELEALVARMEAKANQITKVRKYQAQVNSGFLYYFLMIKKQNSTKK